MNRAVRILVASIDVQVIAVNAFKAAYTKHVKNNAELYSYVVTNVPLLAEKSVYRAQNPATIVVHIPDVEKFVANRAHCVQSRA